MQGCGSVLGQSFVAGLRSFKVGKILGNVDTDMHVRYPRILFQSWENTGKR